MGTMTAADPSLIAIDWGTTSFRAYLVGGRARVLERVAEPFGILNVPDGNFEAAFERLIGPWLARLGELPVLACGMIGSRQGWREAPYAECPATTGSLAGKLVEIATRAGQRLWLVPGVMQVDADGVPDVMRGEETQVVGSLRPDDPRPRLFVLPGTHSKWVMAKGDRIVRFATFMTGELYALLRENSILARLMEGDSNDPTAFRRGVAYAAGGQGELLKRLFSARTLGLFNKLPATGLASYLSGLMIGAEVAEASRWFGAARRTASAVTVIGSAQLAKLYRSALQARGFSGRLGPEDAAVPGLVRIAAAAGLLPPRRAQ
jgi:2-dehydro-3-deoxygalactonokinase